MKQQIMLNNLDHITWASLPFLPKKSAEYLLASVFSKIQKVGEEYKFYIDNKRYIRVKVGEKENYIKKISRYMQYRTDNAIVVDTDLNNIDWSN